MRISDWSSDVCSSDLMVGIQIALSFALILAARAYQLPELVAAAAPAVALLVALGLASVLKARLLSRILGAPVSGWRWALLPAVAVAVVVGAVVTRVPEWGELIRSEEHTSELQPLMRISYAVFCLKKHTRSHNHNLHK